MSGSDPAEVIVLFEIIKTLIDKAIPFDQSIVRSAGVRYANEDDFLTGNGAASFGARWNPIGIRAVYGATDILTATMEAYQNFVEYHHSLSSLKPRVTAGAQVKLEAVFDLTISAIRRRIGFTLKELMDEDWQEIQAAGAESWTQAIGRGCYQAGYEAMLVPSARNRKGTNLVIFPENLHKGSRVKLIAPRDLPPHPSTWPS